MNFDLTRKVCGHLCSTVELADFDIAHFAISLIKYPMSSLESDQGDKLEDLQETGSTIV